MTLKIEKWKAENDNLPRKLRRPVPVKPDKVQIFKGDGGIDMDAMNEAAWQASKLQLVECENCGRRFQPDRLGVHQRSCRPGNAAKKIGGASANGFDMSDYQPATANTTSSNNRANEKGANRGVVPPSNSSVSSIDSIRLGPGTKQLATSKPAVYTDSLNGKIMITFFCLFQ